MDDTIVLISDSDNSDVEIIESKSQFNSQAKLPPLSAVKIKVDDASVNLAKMPVKIEDTRLISTELNILKRVNLHARPLVDLTESNSDTENEQESDKFTLYDPQIFTPVHATTAGLSPLHFCQRLETELSSLGFPMPLLKGRGQSDHKTTVASNSPPDESSQVESTKVTESKVRGGLKGNWELKGELLNVQLSQGLEISPHPASSTDRSLVRTTSPTATGDRSASIFQGNISCSSEQLETKQANSLSFCITSHHKHTPDSGHSWLDANPKRRSKKVQADDSLDVSERLCCDTTAPPQPSTSDINGTDQRSLTNESIVDLEETSYFFWQDASYDEQSDEESRFESDLRSPSPDDAAFVCPAALSKLMSGQTQSLSYWQDEDQETAVALPSWSLRLVYITIEEHCAEGTLELLSDLLQPGFYPPTDITAHLVRGILLDPQCPYHLCVQAFKLLIRTQRYHFVDKATVPWDWELLNTVMDNQDSKTKLKCSVVAMFLEYVVQTLEDDFHVKSSASALQQSIAKETLSCNHQISHVRDVLKWLFTAISKSAERAERPAGADRELEEQMRIVLILQRMLSLALEVDRSPTLHAAKVSQELFHMLIGTAVPRAHRMLLLESLQSTVLTYKLLMHLLDYACLQKTSLPMSRSLLLYFMKNCTLPLDPEDGTERWRRWEELVQLLWMLLLSYNNAVKGFLSSSTLEQRGSFSTYREDDLVSRSAVREAGQALLSRIRADAGQELPPPVEEAFSHLQDYLLEMCHC